MYGNTGVAAGGTGAAGGLAATGFDALWLVFAALALITLGIVVRNVIPKREF